MKFIILVLTVSAAFPALACDQDKALDLWTALQSQRSWVLSKGDANYEKAALISCKTVTSKPAGYYLGTDNCISSNGQKISSKDIIESCKYFISIGNDK